MKKTATPDPNEPPKSTAKEILGLHYKAFNIANKLDEDCLERLLKCDNPDAPESCKVCGSLDVNRKYGDRVGRCNSCKEKYHVTAGTFFEKIQLPRQWLWAIRLKEDGVRVNSYQFSQVAEIAYDTAWNMFRKLDIVIANELVQDTRADNVWSGAFCCAVNKRSLETPANEHPVAEQTKMEEQEQRVNNSTSPDAEDVPMADPARTVPTNKATESGLSGSAKKIFELLSSKPLHFDDLVQQSGIHPGPLSSILMMLELDGLVVKEFGDTFIVSPPSSWLRKAPGNFAIRNRSHGLADQANQAGNATDASWPAYVDAIVQFFKSGFHGISRKYLQLYLAGYWCYTDKRKWSSDSLLKACRTFRTITREDIQSFVSPLRVKVIAA